MSRRFDSGMGGGMKTAIPVLLLFMLMPLEARKHRGVWFWKSTGNPYGSAAIVGVSALENQTIAFFSAQSIRRVYGSYGTRSISEPAVIAAWNAKLDAAGIEASVGAAMARLGPAPAADAGTAPVRLREVVTQ